jgi:hypothetical protein
MIWYQITLVSKGVTDIYTCSQGSLPREYVSARVAVAQRCVRLTWTCQSGGLVLVHVNENHERSDGWLSACGMRILSCDSRVDDGEDVLEDGSVDEVRAYA